MRKKNAITIKDIARELNLSIATISRSLKDSYQISEETKKRVKEFAEKHNYKPNLIAQSLKNQKSRSIGLLLCNIPNTFFAEVINGIESMAKAKNYHLVITQSHESFLREKQNLDFLHDRAVDGIIVSISTETKSYKHFEDIMQEVPIVFFDRVADIENAHKVVSNNLEGVYAGTKHLIANGFKNIAHITSAEDLSMTQERINGYIKALLEARIPVRKQNIKYCEHGGMLTTEVEKVIDELLLLKPAIDAIITVSDRITIETLSYLQKKGIAIPDEIGIVGFSNFTAPDLFYPPLTTIKQSAFEMGKTAADLLIKQIETKKPIKEFEHVILPMTLTVRKSSVKVKNVFHGND